MKRTIFFLVPMLLIAVCISLFSRDIDAQSDTRVQYHDDPNTDNVPMDLRLNPPATVLSTPDNIVTIDDYDNFDIGVDFAEVHVGMNPRNPLQQFAAWNNLTSSLGARGWVSNDGNTWAVSNPTWGGTMFGDPVVAYDSLGNLFFDNMSGSSSITGTKVAKSTNNGANWTVVAGNTGNDKNWIAADQTNGPYSNYLYLTMTNGTSGSFKRSTDNGQTFVSTTNFNTQSLPGMMVCVGPNGATSGGSVYVVTNSGSQFASTYTFYRSTDGGATFNLMSAQNFANYVGTNVGSRNSVQNMRTRPYPYITADNSNGPNRGRLYLVYASNTPVGNGNKPDIFCRYSTDGGATWSTETKINDDANSQNNHQWMPAIWCDKTTGRLYAQWMDTRDVPTSDSCYIYASYSTNGGTSFVQNQRVSNRKFKINCTSCNGGTPAYLGDYNSIVSNSKTSLLAWTDFRSNNFGNYLAYFPDFAMRVTPPVDSANSINGNATFSVAVPDVKLYSDTVLFTAQVNSPPAVGTINVTFPSGNTLTSFPGQVTMNVTVTGGVPLGNYIITVTGKGPNGTPVHKRNVTLYIDPLTSTGGNEAVLNDYKLSQNYPNPFNPVTKIDYSLRVRTDVKITVYDLVGKVVATIERKEQEAGSHSIQFNGANLASGMYFYKLETPEFTDIKKMMLVK